MANSSSSVTIIQPSEYSYFDQYNQSVTIDLTSALQNYSNQNNYNYQLSNYQPVTLPLVNIFTQVEFLSNFLSNNITYFQDYIVSDGEKIEMVSYNLYGSKDYWWIIAMINNIQGINDWVMDNDTLQSLSVKLASSQNIYPASTYYQILSQQNESKRNITVLQKEYVSEFISQFLDSITQNV